MTFTLVPEKELDDMLRAIVRLTSAKVPTLGMAAELDKAQHAFEMAHAGGEQWEVVRKSSGQDRASTMVDLARAQTLEEVAQRLEAYTALFGHSSVDGQMRIALEGCAALVRSMLATRADAKSVEGDGLRQQVKQRLAEMGRLDDSTDPADRAQQMAERLRRDYGPDIRGGAAQDWLARCIDDAEKEAVGAALRSLLKATTTGFGHAGVNLDEG